MPLERSLRLAVEPQARLATLPLGPEEFFVVSRIEGSATVAEIIGSSGLGAAATERILERLLALGALRRVDAAPPATPSSAPFVPPRKRQSTQELRAQAEDRRRRVLQQQLLASRRPTPVPASMRPPVLDPAALAATDAALDDDPDDAPDRPPGLAMVEPVAADDPRLDPAVGVPVEQQRWLLALEDRLDQLSPFELLGLRPTHDLKAIRTAFRDASRRLHPDAHRGRELGRYRTLLATLFSRAKAAHDALQKDEVRTPWVEAAEHARAERKRRAEQRAAARQAEQEERRRREEQAAAERRLAREAQRAERERERLITAQRAKVAEYLQAAADAEAMESYARAANNYRLAMEIDPHDDSIRPRWEHARAIARRRRAKDAFARACTLVEAGHHVESVALFLEAADADPTVEHLAHAADAVRNQDPARGRDLAMAALRALVEQDKGDAPLRAAVVADLRLMIGRAFLAAGQAESAAEQARLVQRLRPGDPRARALLNSAKVT